MDASNNEMRFDRNRIRCQLLPLLKEQYNPNINATLHRTANLCRDEDQWLDAHLAQLLDQIVSSATPDTLVIDLEGLAAQPRVLQRRLMRSALRQWRGHLKKITALHIEALIELGQSGRPDSRLNLPGGLMAQHRKSVLQIHTPNSPVAISESVKKYQYTLTTVETLPNQILLPEVGGCMHFAIQPPPKINDFKALNKNEAWFDIDKLDFPLCIRSRIPGDRFIPMGAPGTQKLKKFYIDSKIPKGQRSKTPLLISAQHILWVVGLRRSNRALIDETTALALYVNFEC